ncbi:polyphosphate kinase 1 [Gracilimonas mengyeensis]|uniref:Polyphosphate kinase n=1 Tax=Gracilimonas mengyeensis TaxID=1302730 RepID=A0A521DEZ7_9BACT|nr:polyphosphate kinase 1 [Gracilimonas mengyeensis]SMO70152.1 polyphosphate kinase [Gracilimonas mengyeensis]
MKKNSLSPDEIELDPSVEQRSNMGSKQANPKKNEILKRRGMHKDLRSSNLKIFGDEYFLNYELSWLKFNGRVLEEAQNSKNKLLERITFLSIVCSNLDEFFQKRVGGLKRQLMARVKDLSVDGMTPSDQLRAIRKEVKSMIETYRKSYFEELRPALDQKGIHIKRYSELTDFQKSVCDRYFQKQIYPIVTPLAVDESHPFPFISNKSLSFAIELQNPRTKEKSFARLKIPANRNRFIEADRAEQEVVLIPIEDLIYEKMDQFFPGMDVLSAHIFRVTRNASVDRNEEEAEDLLETIEDELRERKFAEIVRLEIDVETPRHIKEYLIENLKISRKDVYEMRGTIGLADVMQIARLSGFSRLKERNWVPVLHPALKHNPEEELPSIFEVIKKGDFMVHHPYHSFEFSTQRFLEEAAEDPKVLAIKQTLYRTSKDSPLMHSLMNAAEEGKQVVVLVEIKARFDEERNINWAQKLENYGVHVAYGIPGLKIHTKMTMVVREENDGLKTYCHIGTGNYHPDTAQLYEDLALFTSDDDIGSDVTDVFNLLTGYAPEQSFEKLLVAPRHMRKQMSALIDKEIEEAEQGNTARIIAKMNSLEDPLIIQKLYKASAAGVKIDLIVRGVCRLIPGKEGLSENIQVHSIIGRFLEHSRIYYFHHAGEHKYFMGSADWMHRNLDARVEAITPIEREPLKKYLQYVLNVYLRDNTQRWILQADGSYERVQREKGTAKCSTHKLLMAHMKESRKPVPLVD